MPADGLDLARFGRIHIVGIGGAGMSGLARVLVGLGHAVSGSDLRETYVTHELRASGISVAIGHDAANIDGAALVTASPAVAPSNPELVAARARGVRVAPRAELLAAIAAMRRTLAIAGTHGKTTTASMLARILTEAGHAPSWLIGAEVPGLGANAHVAAGEELVMEADESYGSFSLLAPHLVAVTSVEADHLDHYGTFDALCDAFGALMDRAEVTVVHADDPVAARIGAHRGAIRVGTSPLDDVCIGDVALSRASSTFVLSHPSGSVEITVGSPGRHNVANAAVAAASAIVEGVDDAAVAAALGRFAGVPRRFEFRGEALGATVVDDYAHLPGEVAAVVAAAVAGRWSRIVAVFQPHRFTRTEAVAPAFAGAFDGVDVVIVTGIYAAGEPPLPGVTGRLVADAIAAHPGAPEVHYVEARNDVAGAVEAVVRDGDLLVTMGAGDLTSLADELRERAR